MYIHQYYVYIYIYIYNNVIYIYIYNTLSISFLYDVQKKSAVKTKQRYGTCETQRCRSGESGALHRAATWGYPGDVLGMWL